VQAVTTLFFHTLTSPLQAFTGADVYVAVGGFPRKPGMERKDLIAKNASIFSEQGDAIEKFASKNIKVLVVANPANTNCLILKSKAKSIPPQNFTALTYLDHNRARAQIALKLGVSVSEVRKVCIWGNHSSTQVPDHTNGLVTVDGSTKTITAAVNDDDYLAGEFVSTVAKRGAAIIAARQLSSAMSAANAIADHLRTWLVHGSRADDFVSLAVHSDGSYGIAEGLVYSFPVTCTGDGTYTIVQGLSITPEKQTAMKASETELLEEKSAAAEAGFI
jgi:malate dehydrogenase